MTIRRHHFAVLFIALLIAVFLLACGATGRDRELISAAAAGELTKVNSLIAMGASIESQALEDRATPLTSAAKNGHAEVVVFLVGRGAQVNHKDGGGTPVFWAVHSGRADVVRFLVAHGGRLSVGSDSEEYLRKEVQARGDGDLQRLFDQIVVSEKRGD
jgi:ankyrin repeat protein